MFRWKDSHFFLVYEKVYYSTYEGTEVENEPPVLKEIPPATYLNGNLFGILHDKTGVATE